MIAMDRQIKPTVGRFHIILIEKRLHCVRYKIMKLIENKENHKHD